MTRSDDLSSHGTDGLRFGEGADAYDRCRPSFPPEAIGWGMGHSPLAVLDLGAGTGLMTRVLTSAGHRVIAVEPDPLMRTRLRVRASSGCDVRDGSAESIPLGDAEVDCVVAAESFHWFDRTVALAEIARVLRPGGRLLIVWNLRDSTVAWVAELEEILARYNPGSVYDDGGLPDVEPWFGDLEEHKFPHAHILDQDGLVGLVSTFSYVARSPHRQQILDQVANLARSHPALTARTAFDLPYTTRAIRCIQTTPPSD